VATNPESQLKARLDAVLASELGSETGLTEQADYMLVATQKNKHAQKKETTKKTTKETPKKTPKKK
jgi:hypothetical protein